MRQKRQWLCTEEIWSALCGVRESYKTECSIYHPAGDALDEVTQHLAMKGEAGCVRHIYKA